NWNFEGHGSGFELSAEVNRIAVRRGVLFQSKNTSDVTCTKSPFGVGRARAGCICDVTLRPTVSVDDVRHDANGHIGHRFGLVGSGQRLQVLFDNVVRSLVRVRIPASSL